MNDVLMMRKKNLRIYMFENINRKIGCITKKMYKASNNFVFSLAIPHKYARKSNEKCRKRAYFAVANKEGYLIDIMFKN